MQQLRRWKAQGYAWDQMAVLCRNKFPVSALVGTSALASCQRSAACMPRNIVILSSLQRITAECGRGDDLMWECTSFLLRPSME